MYTAVQIFMGIAQGVIAAVIARGIASTRSGANARRWAVVGLVLGPLGALIAWRYAGRADRHLHEREDDPLWPTLPQRR